jgi:hypothetical protein
VVSIMPCTAKKFEAKRPEMRVLGYCVNWVCRLKARSEKNEKKARSEKNEKNRCYVAD